MSTDPGNCRSCRPSTARTAPTATAAAATTAGPRRLDTAKRGAPGRLRRRRRRHEPPARPAAKDLGGPIMTEFQGAAAFRRPATTRRTRDDHPPGLSPLVRTAFQRAACLDARLCPRPTDAKTSKRKGYSDDSP
jgi:hypothetical protein